MEQKLTVAVGARQWTEHQTHDAESEAGCSIQHLTQHPIPHRRIADDAASPTHLHPSGLELGLDERDEMSTRSGEGHEGWQDRPQGDEAEVGNDQIDRVVQVVGAEVTHVGSLPDVHSSIGPQPLVELAMADVHRHHPQGTVLEEAIGEASRRGPGIEGDPAGRVDAEALECCAQLLPAPGYVTRPVTLHDQRLARSDHPRWFRGHRTTDKDPPRFDQDPGSRAGRAESSSLHLLVQSPTGHSYPAVPSVDTHATNMESTPRCPCVRGHPTGSECTYGDRVIPIHDENPTRTTAWLTVVLIVVNIAVFALLQPKDQGTEDIIFAYRYATVPCEVAEGRPLTLNENPTVRGATGICGDAAPGSGQACDSPKRVGDCTPFPGKSVWLSLLTSMFLHGGWLHLGSNMLFLWVFGNNVEDHMGPVRYGFFYLGAGLVATLAHIAIDPASTVPLLGASGAVAGVMGVYLVWFPEARVRTLVVVLLIVFVRIRAKWLLALWFASQFFIDPNQGVAWMAHVGGFVAGALVGLAVRESQRARTLLWRSAYLDDRSGLWDNRLGGRSEQPLPPYQPPDFS